MLISKIKIAEGSNIESTYKIPLGDPENFLDELAKKTQTTS